MFQIKVVFFASKWLFRKWLFRKWGVAKYVSQLVDGGALDKETMIRHIVSPNSTFLNEGKLSGHVSFYEIKRQADEISIGVLRQRAEVMLQATHESKKYDISYKGLSMENM